MSRILFIGGPGNISTTTIEQLVAAGHKVAVFTHPKELPDWFLRHVHFYFGDRNDEETLGEAVSDFRPEIVADFICFTKEQAEAVVRLVEGRIRQFVFVSTVDVYGYPLSHLPMKEGDPWGTTRTDYATRKRECEEFFRSKEHPDRLPLTIVRPAYSLGSFLLGFTVFDGKHLVRRIRDGLPVLVPGDGTTLIHASSAANTGRMIARVFEAEVSIGEDYSVGRFESMTHDDYVRLIGRVVGREPEIVHLPTDFLLSLGEKSLLHGPLTFLTGFNLFYSMEKFQAHFPDFQWTLSVEDAVQSFIDRIEGDGRIHQAGEEILDDRIIRSWQKMVQKLRIES